MVIIGLFKELTKWLRSKFSGIDDSIGHIYGLLKNHISSSLNVVVSNIENIISNSTEFISKQLDIIVESISAIDFTNMNIINFDTLKKPFESVSEYFIDFLLEALKINGLNVFSTIFDKFKDLDKMPMKSSSPITWQTAMETLNDKFSFMTGIKPFNILFGKESWDDKTKKGLYYEITKTLTFSFIMFFIALPMINTFFSALTVQKTKEYYKFSKLSIKEYVELNKRGFITNDELQQVAKFLGYDLECLDDVIKIQEYYPSVSDLITFAVRESFDDIETLFIYDKNKIPDKFIEYGKKIGLTKEWIQKFWHSHWRLLGVDNILEAFHRNFITKDDLYDYLRRLDYVEKDRQLVLDMSYKLLTRVDVRRIYQQGLITSDELVAYYRTLGFSEKDSKLMTQMSKQMRFIDVKDFRKFYLNRFLEGFETKDELITNLIALGYEVDDIGLFVALSIQERELDYKIKLKERIVELYFNNSIEYDDFVERMKSIGLSNYEIEWIDKYKDISQFRKLKLPTIAELKRYIKKDIIDMSTFIYYAIRLGYDKDVILYILRDIKIV